MVYVIKTISGRRYRYWQESKRVDGRVKTTSVYIGPVDERKATHKQKTPKARSTGPISESNDLD